MIKMTGSGEILATTEDDENILKGGIVLDYVSLMNPDSNMTIDEFIKEIRAGRVPCKGCKDKEK